MKYTSTVAIGIALATPIVSSQSLADLPECARSPGLTAVQQSGCPVSDIPCICSKTSFFEALRASILQACSPQDQAAALAFQNTLCGTYTSTSIPAASAAPAAGTPASDPDMSMASMAASMLSSMSSGSVAYAAYSGTTTMSAGTAITSNGTAMHVPSNSASMNMMSMGGTDTSKTGTGPPAQFTGGAPSKACVVEREWLVQALGVMGIFVALS